MEKKRKKTIIIGITCLFLVMILLLGLTYAYYRTRIIGNNSNEPSINVQSKKLELVYSDGSANINVPNIEPSNENVYTKTFRVTNTGDTTIENYSVYLEDVINNYELKSDLVYTLSCVSYLNYGEDEQAVSGTCNGVSSNTTFPSVVTKIVTNTIAAEYTHEYTISIKYLETGVDQSIDMGKSLRAKINIYDEETKFLASEIVSNAMLGQNGTTYVEPNMLGVTANTSKPAANISLAEEKIVSYTFDDYGTSYYFRGNVENNYVNYAGMCFRIVRIEGDGSIKLVLEDKNTTCDNASYTGNWAIANVSYGTDRYNIGGQGVYQADYLDPTYLTAGGMKLEIDTWLSNSNINTNDLKEDVWCQGDITNLYSTTYPFQIISNETTTRDSLIQSKTEFYYEAFTRIGDEGIDGEQWATLKCEKNNYSSFNAYSALLTADEIVLGGAKQGTENSSFYLLNDYHKNATGKMIKWLSLTLGKFNGVNDRVIGVESTGRIGNISAFQKNGTAFDIYARPAITLKADSVLDFEIEGQNGTKTNPYVIG